MNGSTPRTLFIVLAFVTVIPTVVRGETARDQAREQARQGRTLYEEGRYQDALEAYRAAFELAPAPGVLFNLGQCYRHLGDMASALEYYERYLSESPTAANRPAVEALIEQCRTQLVQVPGDAGPPDVALPADGGLGAGTTADDDAGARPTGGQTHGDIDAAPTHSDEPGLEPQQDFFYGDSTHSSPDTALVPEEAGGAAAIGGGERSRLPVYRRWWFWTLIGAAVVGATVGAVVGVTSAEPTVVLPQGSLGTLDGRGQSDK